MDILQVLKDEVLEEGTEKEVVTVDIVDLSTALLHHILVVERVLKCTKNQRSTYFLFFTFY